MKTVIIGAITGFVNGLFGSGGGTILVPALQKYLKVDVFKSHATAIAVILPFSVVSSFLYFGSASVDFKVLAQVSAGGVFGGFIGAKCLTKLSKNGLHKIFGAVMVVAAVRMIL